MVTFQDLRELLLPTFYKIFYALLPLSFLGYAIVGSLRMKGKGINLNRRVLYFSIIVLAVEASFFLTLRFTKPEAPNYSFPVLMIYLIMLTATMILVYYRLLRLKEERLKSPKHASLTGKSPQSAYRNSTLPEETLSKLEQKIIQILEQEKPYLDGEYSLSDMAGQLRITSHRLSQTLSARFQKNFSQLLNSYRIEEACRLMDQEPQLSL